MSTCSSLAFLYIPMCVCVFSLQCFRFFSILTLLSLLHGLLLWISISTSIFCCCFLLRLLCSFVFNFFRLLWTRMRRTNIQMESKSSPRLIYKWICVSEAYYTTSIPFILKIKTELIFVLYQRRRERELSYGLEMVLSRKIIMHEGYEVCDAYRLIKKM